MILHSIDFATRPLMEKLYHQYGHGSSAMHFSSLYVWRNEMQLSVYLQPDLFAVKAGWRGQNYWFFPCGKEQAKKEFLLSLAAHPSVFLCYACEEDVAFAKQHLPGVYQFSHTPQDDEYLYERSQQVELAGKKYRHQRNALNRLNNNYSLGAQPLSDKTLGDAFTVLKAWSEKSHDTAAGGLIGCNSVQELLTDWKALDVRGVVVYEKDVPVALAAGYPLSSDCFDLSACIQSMENSDFSVFARHRLFQHLGGSFTVVNTEEDLGLAGLRTVKQGMHPCKIIQTYEGRIYDSTFFR